MCLQLPLRAGLTDFTRTAKVHGHKDGAWHGLSEISNHSVLPYSDGMANAWKKFKDLAEIEAFQYHNW